MWKQWHAMTRSFRLDLWVLEVRRKKFSGLINWMAKDAFKHENHEKLVLFSQFKAGYGKFFWQLKRKYHEIPVSDSIIFNWIRLQLWNYWFMDVLLGLPSATGNLQKTYTLQCHHIAIAVPLVRLIWSASGQRAIIRSYPYRLRVSHILVIYYY